MRQMWSKKWIQTGVVLLSCLGICTLAVFSQPYGRLAQPEKTGPDSDRFIGFHLVYERMPQEGEEIPVDETHWVEYGTQTMEAEGLGALEFPRKILVGSFTGDPNGQDYQFAGLPGLNCFLTEKEMEGGGKQYAGTSGLADAHIKVGDEGNSLSGTAYFGPPVDDRNWNTENFDYGWTAYRVYQMEDGTVYLDGSGNSYGGMGGFTVKESVEEKQNVSGEEETRTFSVEFTLESVERTLETVVSWFDGEDRCLEKRILTMEEIGEGYTLPRPEGSEWALVSVVDRQGTVERAAYTLGENGAAHRLVRLDERGMGRVVYLTLE